MKLNSETAAPYHGRPLFNFLKDFGRSAEAKQMVECVVCLRVHQRGDRLCKVFDSYGQTMFHKARGMFDKCPYCECNWYRTKPSA